MSNWRTLPATKKLINPWGWYGYVFIRVYPFFAENLSRAKMHDISQGFFEGKDPRVRGYLKEDVGEGVVGFRIGVHYSLANLASGSSTFDLVKSGLTTDNIMRLYAPKLVKPPNLDALDDDHQDIFWVMWEYQVADDLTLTFGNPFVKKEFTKTRMSYDVKVDTATSLRPHVTAQVVVNGPATTSTTTVGGDVNIIVANASGSVSTSESPDVNVVDTDPLEIEMHLPIVGDYVVTRIFDENLFRYVVEFDTGQQVPPMKKQQTFDAWLRSVKDDPDIGDWVKRGMLPIAVEGRASELGTYPANVTLSNQRKDWTVKRLKGFISSKLDPDASGIGVPPGAKKGANQADQVAIVTLDRQKSYDLQKSSMPKRPKRW